MSVAFGSHGQKPTKRRSKTSSTRHTWSAELRGDLLRPFRGSWTTTIDKDGSVLDRGRDQAKALWVNIGSRLLLEHEPAVTIVRVVGVEPDGVGLRVAHVSGDLVPDGTCWVMKVAP